MAGTLYVGLKKVSNDAYLIEVSFFECYRRNLSTTKAGEKNDDLVF